MERPTVIQDVGAALSILEQAMKIEQEGRSFYLKAAGSAPDEKGRKTFATLAQDEGKHYRLIKKQHTALTQSHRWLKSAEVKAVELDLNEALFPGQDALQKLARSSDREALLFGLDIEVRSYDLYRKAASETGDTLGKQMFEFLAGEERGHFNILMMRYDGLFGPMVWQA